ncbi:MAG TPA: T9SS type A sorting domain-containing protein [Bacteroidia bacterium]|jgi:hypothetical protein|nr:T9SS type A sorting domain-containing protein [Bacteroidia bacterium]
MKQILNISIKKFLFLLSLIAVFHAAKTQNYFVSTVAGNNAAGLLDGTGTAAICNAPYSVKSDGANAIYFADTYNHAIRKYDVISGQVTTVAGNGVPGYQDGPCSTARFHFPEGVFYKNHFLYVGDNLNNVIRKIDLINNIVSTIAGSGIQGYSDGPANQAQFYQPKYLIVDNNNNIFVADYENHCIRKISNGQVTTIAGVGGVPGYQNGPGNSALFYRTADLCMDTTTGNIYVTDIMNNVIRKIDANLNVTTFAGTGVAGNVDGPAGSAQFTRPTAIDITCKNNFIYVADGSGGNNIRKISLSNGIVSTVAGVYPTIGWQDGQGTSALFNQIQGLCFDPHGSLYIGDAYNNRIRKIIVPEGAAGNPCIFNNDINSVMSPARDFNIYPDPSDGILNFEIFNNSKNGFYTISNTIGQTIKTGEVIWGKNRIDLYGFENGIYILSVFQNNQTINKKIIVQK